MLQVSIPADVCHGDDNPSPGMKNRGEISPLPDLLAVPIMAQGVMTVSMTSSMVKAGYSFRMFHADCLLGGTGNSSNPDPHNHPAEVTRTPAPFAFCGSALCPHIETSPHTTYFLPCARVFHPSISSSHLLHGSMLIPLDVSHLTACQYAPRASRRGYALLHH